MVVRRVVEEKWWHSGGGNEIFYCRSRFKYADDTTRTYVPDASRMNHRGVPMEEMYEGQTEVTGYRTETALDNRCDQVQPLPPRAAHSHVSAVDGPRSVPFEPTCRT